MPPGGDHEGLPAQERGGDVQERSRGGGALGHHGVPARRSSDQHRLRDKVLIHLPLTWPMIIMHLPQGLK